jgi:hypothetical protein
MLGLRVSDERFVVELRDQRLRFRKVPTALIRKNPAVPLHILRREYGDGNGLCDGVGCSERRKSYGEQKSAFQAFGSFDTNTMQIGGFPKPTRSRASAQVSFSPADLRL